MLVWGHGRKLHPLAALWQMEGCPSCHRPAMLNFGVLKKDFRLYWVPVAKWNSAYYVFCAVCSASYEVPKEAGKKIHMALESNQPLSVQSAQQLIFGRTLEQSQGSKQQTSSSSTPQAPSSRKVADAAVFDCSRCGVGNRIGSASLGVMKCGRCGSVLASQNPFTVLGLGANASREEIESAYLNLAQIYHPDRFVSSSEGVRSEAEKKMKQINEARSFFGTRRNP